MPQTYDADMIKMSWTLIGEHADEWTGADTQEGAAVLEARIEAAVDAGGMPPETVRSWHERILAPAIEALRTEGTSALSQGKSWSVAVGPLLLVVSPTP